MLFHLGAVWYLNQGGYLPRLARISSVSGGSILAACLGLKWRALRFDRQKMAVNFLSEIVGPIRALASTTIDTGSVVGGLLPAVSAGGRLIEAYEEHLLGKATLQDLPHRPRFVINATNVQSGALFRFSRPYIWDYRVGRISHPTTRLSEAVAASSAFPPVLSPITLRFPAGAFDDDTGHDLGRPPFTRSVVLTDGGVYDNLGLETAWKRYRTILVSDGGAKLQPETRPKSDWVRHSLRIMNVVDNQVRSLRKRQLISSFRAKSRSGAYWGIRSNIGDYKLADAFECPHEKTMRLAEMETRLEELPARTQERLINWGFAIADAAMRRHVDASLQRPAGLPYPGVGW